MKVYLPNSAEDVQALGADILLCMAGSDYDENIIDYLSRYPHTVYVFYTDDDELVAFCRLDDRALDPLLGKNTVEIHGYVLTEHWEKANEAETYVLTQAFSVKKNVIAKIDPKNNGAKGFCLKWGFKKINTEHGLSVYRLKKNEFMERVKK